MWSICHRRLAADWLGRTYKIQSLAHRANTLTRCNCCHGDQKRRFLKGSGGWEGFGSWRKGVWEDERRLFRRTTGEKKKPARSGKGRERKKPARPLQINERNEKKSGSLLDPKTNEWGSKVQHRKSNLCVRNLTMSRHDLLLDLHCIQQDLRRGKQKALTLESSLLFVNTSSRISLI